MAKLQFTDLDDHMTNPFSIAEHLQLMVRNRAPLQLNVHNVKILADLTCSCIFHNILW